MDEKKIITLPQTAKSIERLSNTAHVETQTRSSNDELSLFIKKNLDGVGKRACPNNQQFLGAAVIFYYQELNTTVDRPVYQTICQTLLENVPEGFADFGHKRLQESMQRAYGRKPPEIRQDI